MHERNQTKLNPVLRGLLRHPVNKRTAGWGLFLGCRGPLRAHHPRESVSQSAIIAAVDSKSFKPNGPSPDPLLILCRILSVSTLLPADSVCCLSVTIRDRAKTHRRHLSFSIRQLIVLSLFNKKPCCRKETARCDAFSRNVRNRHYTTRSIVQGRLTRCSRNNKFTPVNTASERIYDIRRTSDLVLGTANCRTISRAVCRETARCCGGITRVVNDHGVNRSSD